MLDHDDRVRPARQHASGSDRHCGSRQHLAQRHHGRRDGFGQQFQAARLLFGRTIGVLGANRESVEVRPVERGNIDRGYHVLGQHSSQTLRQRHRFFAQRPQRDRGLEPPFRFVAVDHIQKLILRFHRYPRSRIRENSDLPRGFPSSSEFHTPGARMSSCTTVRTRQAGRSDSVWFGRIELPSAGRVVKKVAGGFSFRRRQGECISRKHGCC